MILKDFRRLITKGGYPLCIEKKKIIDLGLYVAVIF